MLPALQPCWAAAAACGGLWARLAPATTAAAVVSGANLTIGGSRALRAAAAAASPAAWQRRFEGVAPGSVLRIDLPDSPADVSVRVGEHEAVEVSSSMVQLEAEQAPHDGHPGSSVVSIRQAAAQQQPAHPQPLQLAVRGPSRFFSLEACTAGGSVAVEVIQEGSVRLSTGGGSISVPKVKAFDAHLDSGGGAIAGSVTGVDVQLRSGGGPVSLKGLVGKRAAVDSGGGAVALGACYADQLRVQSGGGPIHVTNMDCRGGVAALASSGGRVVVDSLDGNLSIHSGGGDVQVQLHDNAGEVSISSGGGDIQLFLNPAVAGRLLLRNCARVAARPGTVRHSQPQEDGSLTLALPLSTAADVPGGGGGAPPLSRLQRAAAAAADEQQAQQQGPRPGNVVMTARRILPPGGAQVVLDAGGRGSVSISERSWMDALKQRYGG
ncbi:hypothetical protein ABPG75_011063 [Micractinium tetrahymenae]